MARRACYKLCLIVLIKKSMARFVVLNNIVYDVMAIMETHDRDNMCL
jgi:hypothetical protein